MTDCNKSPNIEFLKELALSAGEIARRVRTSGELNIEAKSPRDLVTKADLEIDQFIREQILEHFPEHSILSEELAPNFSAEDLQEKPIWVIDPIDGTHNFAHGLPHTAVSIAFARAGTVELGVVYAPFYQEIFSAERGKGAFLNSQQIKVKYQRELPEATIALGRPFRVSDTPEFLAEVSALVPQCFDFRRFGAASLDLCFVGCERFDAFYETLQPWDMAAAALFVKEAGGCVRHLKSNKQNYPEDLNPFALMACSSVKLADQVTTVIKSA